MGQAIPLRVETGLRDRRGRPLRDLRISVLDRCNFRCPYCMPQDRYPRDHRFLHKAERLRFEEIVRIVRAAVPLGVRKLRLTGGEPLLRRDLPDLVRMLASVPGIEDIALTSNGVLLAAQAQLLHAAGLGRITLSLDALDPQVFRHLSGGLGEVGQVLGAIDAAEQAGFARLKINCVVLRGVNETEVLPLVERFRGTAHVLRFIEYMDVGTCNDWSRRQVVSGGELRERIAARWPLRALPASAAGEVARRYAFEDGAGEIGFIDSVSAPFCGDCTRARLSADGRIYTCLFAGQGHDLRGALRGGACDEELSRMLAAIWHQRDDRYSELRAQVSESPREHVEMYAIGG